jgi:hypothetical protein
MAKHRSKHRSRALVRTSHTVRPVVIKKTIVKKGRSRHHSSHFGLGGFLSQQQINAGLGGAALGFIQKQFPNLPKIPILGEAGTVAVAAWMLRGKVPLANDVATAAIVVAAYQLTSTGKIVGDAPEGTWGGF